jgi:hypothetical protein
MRFAWLAALLELGACGSGTPGGGAHACTLIGCFDQFTATLHDANGGLPSGMQTLTVMADGATTTCSFTLPLASGMLPACPGLQVQVIQQMSCVTSGSGQYKMQSCTLVAGKFSEVVTLMGRPATVNLTQTSDGAKILDQMLTPTYATTQPGCDPVCAQAGAELVLTAP